MFTVNLCGAHPDNEDFDECWTGEDYVTLAEARAVFDAKNPIVELAASADNPALFAAHYHDVPFVWLDGPGVSEVRKLREPRPSQVDDDEWRRERAMQAGMGLGVQAYNEEMGWG